MKTGSINHYFSTEAQHLLESLTSAPQCPRDPFLVEGLTFEQLYDLMEIIRIQCLRGLDSSAPICLCAENRAHVTAAMLATLRQGPPLLLPHAFTRETLAEGWQSMRYPHALIEKAYELPECVKALPWPQAPGPSTRMVASAAIEWDTPWLYLFTGGSTGTPRIWSKTPRNLLMEALNIKRTFDISPRDVILATVPPNHIYGLLYSILLPLVSGASVSTLTPSFPLEIAQSLEKTQATVLVSIPAHYRALKQIPGIRHRVRIAFSSAGALMENDSLDFHKNTGIAITEIYGSTETGGIAQRTRPHGQTGFHPFDCASVQINNEHLGVCSDFLSRELDRNEAGYFETADRAAWEKDSSGFAILGRSDGIVKVGGKRVDLAMTRETLMAVQGVRDVYVFSLPVQTGRENEIVALVEGQVEAEQVIQTANSHLPPYARPRVVKVTHQIPISSTGKYNRDAINRLFKPEA
jgi:acyl-coenzyme A synthetase/AMP-(fatty) acid ligase